MNRANNKKGATVSPGANRQSKQMGYLFFMLFATIIAILMVALFNAIWSESVFFQGLLIGSLALLVIGVIVARIVFRVQITTKQVVLWLTLIALAGTSFIGLTSRSGLKQSTAALVINGYAVSAKTLDLKAREVEQTIQQIRAQVGPYADMFLQMRGFVGQPRDIATRELIHEKLLLSLADNIGMTIMSPDYISSRLRDSNFVTHYLSSVIPPYLAQGPAGVDGARLAQYLKHQGIAAADFEESLEDAIRVHVVMSIFPTTVYVPQVSLARASLMTRDKRVFSVEHFELDTYLAKEKKQPVSDEVLKSFFDEQNRAAKRYFTPEKRRGSVWVFTPEDYNLSITDVEVRRYFADHAKDFGTKQLAAVRNEIEKKLTKEKFKKRFAVDAQRVIALNEREPNAFEQFIEKRKARRSTINWTTRNDAKEVQMKALFSLVRVGSRRPLIDEERGYIVQLDEIEQSVLSPLAQVKDRVMADFQKERAEKALLADLEMRRTQVATQGIAALKNPQTISLASKEDWEKMQKKGLPVDRMRRMTHPGAVIADMQDAGDKSGVCIVLSSIEPVDGDDTNTKKRFAREFSSREVSYFASAFIASLHSSATIKKGGKPRVSSNFNDEE